MTSLTKHALFAAGLPVFENASHFVSLMTGDAEHCKAGSDLLMRRHSICFQPLNFPTVAIGVERLPITPTPRHTEANVSELVEALVDVWRELDLPFTESRIIPLRRRVAPVESECAYREMRKAAE